MVGDENDFEVFVGLPLNGLEAFGSIGVFFLVVDDDDRNKWFFFHSWI